MKNLWFIAILFFVSQGYAATYYVTQAGGGAGSSCASANSAAWFNTAGHYTAGDTIHLCGAFTYTDNTSTALTVQASGSAGNPITIVCDAGSPCSFVNYAWPTTGAINVNGKSYIILDGNGGTISSTQNGVGLTYQQQTDGIVSEYGTNVEIRNWNIGQLWYRFQGSADANAFGFGITTWNDTNGLIHGNACTGIMWWCIVVTYNGGYNTQNESIYSNSSCCSSVAINVGDGGANAIATNIWVYNNVLSPNTYWDGSGIHDAPIHYYMVQTGSSTTGAMIFNNTMVGDPGINATACLELEQISGALVFNNLCVSTGTNNYAAGNLYTKAVSKATIAADNAVCGSAGLCRSGGVVTVTTTSAHNRTSGEWDFIYGTSDTSFQGTFQITVTSPTQFTYVQAGSDAHSGGGSVYDGSHNAFYNNTVVCSSSSQSYPFIINSGGGETWENNISNCQIGVNMNGSATDMTLSDYNTYYGLGSNQFYFRTGYVTYTNWKTKTFFNGASPDAHSITSNPLLTVTYGLSSSSPARSAAANLTGLGVSQLDYDLANVFRPVSSAWDMGAYQYGPATLPLPIGGITAIPPWPSTPTTTNLWSDTDFAGDTPGNAPGAPWSLSNCSGAVVDNTVYHLTAVGRSLKVTSCGSAGVNGIISQQLTYSGGKTLQLSFWVKTDSSYAAQMDDPVVNITLGSVFSNSAVGRVAPMDISSSNGLTIAIPANSGWIQEYREIWLNSRLYVGDTLQLDIRFPSPGTTAGTIWIAEPSVVEADFPLQNDITYPNFHGYLWSDKVPSQTYYGPSPAAGKIAGNIELAMPYSAFNAGDTNFSTYSVALYVDTAAGCANATGHRQTISITPPTQTVTLPQTFGAWNLGVVHWNFDAATWIAGLGNAAENPPATAYYVCTAATVNSVTYTIPDYRFYYVSPAFRATLTNYSDSDGAIVHRSQRQIDWGAYDSWTAKNRTGTSPGLYSGFGATTSYENLIAGMGSTPPLSTSNATHSGMLITTNGSQAVLDYQINNFNSLMSPFNLFPAVNVTPGSDQLSPWLTVAQVYGFSHFQISNTLYGTGWDEAGQDSANTIPTSPSSVTIGQGGSGDIKDDGTHYAWVEIVPKYWSSLGQAGNTLQRGMTSAAVVSSSAFANATNNYVTVALPSCQGRQIGWGIHVAASTSNSTAPSGDAFYSYSGAENTPFVSCGQTSVTLIGDGTSGGNQGSLNFAYGPILPTSNTVANTPAAVTCTSSCTGTATVNVIIQAVSPGLVSLPSPGFAAVAGSTLTLPALGTGQTGFYISQASSASPNNPWNYFLQTPVGSPVLGGSTYVVPTGAAMSVQQIAPIDTTLLSRPSWESGSPTVTDPSFWQLYTAVMDGSQKAGAQGYYVADEPHPQSTANVWRQMMSPAGMQQNGSYDMFSWGVLVDNTAYRIWRNVLDLVGNDPYCCGSASLADLVWAGDQSRNATIYNGTNNSTGLTSGTSGGVMAPQNSDVGAWVLGRDTYGAKSYLGVIQQFQKVSLERGFPYAELRRAAWKQLIGCEETGNLGCGSMMWNWGNGDAMDIFYYQYANTQAYLDAVQLGQEINSWQYVLESPTLDSSAPTGMAGYYPPGVGTIVSNVTTSQTPAAACGITARAGNYTDSTLFPFGPVRFVTKAIGGSYYIFATNLCGSINSNGTGGTAYAPTFTLTNVIPSGSTVNVVGESRTITMSGHTFTDTSSNWQDQEVHIYQIGGPGAPTMTTAENRK